jgi:hypothetical protein
MATVGSSYLTLADLRRQQNRNDEIADIIEIMAQRNDMLADAPAVECNQGHEHLTTIRSGLPSPTWRRLYEGVQPTKGTTTQVTDATGYMEDWSEVDAKLVERAKDPQKFRMNEAKAHIMGIAHTFASTLIYGNTATEPEKFDGLAVRYSSLTAPNGNQIIDAGGTGSDNTSVWFITWGEQATHLLYPEGSPLGIQREDIGKETKEKSDGSLYQVYREKFAQDVGVSVRDWRQNVRLANIDVSDLSADPNAVGGTGADLIDLMIDAYYQLDNPNAADGNCVIYCSRTIAKFLHKQAMQAKNIRLSIEQYEGRPTTMFLGHPIRRMDAILETEARVV